MDEQQKYELARKRVEAKQGFYSHLAVYVVVNALFIALNLYTPAGGWWFPWPLIGWGIGLLFHGLSVFVFRDPSRMEEKIRKEMRKL